MARYYACVLSCDGVRLFHGAKFKDQYLVYLWAKEMHSRFWWMDVKCFELTKWNIIKSRLLTKVGYWKLEKGKNG